MLITELAHDVVPARIDIGEGTARVLVQVRIVHDELPRRVGAYGLERPALCRVLQSALNFAGREVTTMRLGEGDPDQEA
jgi:hypothetical protein